MSLFEKSDPNPPGAAPDGASGEQRIVTLLKHLFREYADYNELDGDQMRGVKMKDFHLYCTTLNTRWFHDDKEREALKAGYHILDDDLNAVWHCFEDIWAAVALLQPVWHMLALSGRPPVKHIPEFLHIAVTLAWYPGSTREKALRIEVPTKWKAGSALTNGFLCSLLKDQMDGIIQTFAGNGLDALYDKYAVSTIAPGKPQSIPADMRTREGSGL